MGVYMYRLTTKTVKTSDGRVAHVMECLGRGPSYRATERQLSDWERKLRTASNRRAKLAEHSGLYVEDTSPGATVYEGGRSYYMDSHNYVVARDAAGEPITVIDPRKVR